MRRNRGRYLIVTVLVALVFTIPQSLWAQANLENPPPGSFQSGIGIVSGWKCTGGTLTFTIDNGPPAQLSYGTSRLDTQSVCGDSNNGFAYLINWNLLGNGQHIIRVFDNSIQFASATFTVTTLGTEFLSEASGEYILPNFPQTGTDIVVRWQESAQNFVIVEVEGGGCTSGITVYEHANFGGQSKTFTSDVTNFSFVSGPCAGNNFNDCISSIKIPAGCSVTAYVDANFTGQSKTFTADVSNLSFVTGPCASNNFNDCISSLKISAP